MTKFALDTNVVSLILKKEKGVFSAAKAEVAKGNDCTIPPFVYYEIKRGLLATNASTKLSLFEKLCFEFSVGEMDFPAWEKAAELHVQLRRQGRPIGDADILIAAFCIVRNYTLVTENTKHFERVAGLQYVSCQPWLRN